MEFISLGKSNLLVSKTSFGAMSLDCKEIEAFGEEADEKACGIVHHAYSGGMNFFDISHSKPVCEKRLGAALHGIRHNVILATKTSGQSAAEIRRDLNESLDALESDFIDLYQIENPLVVPKKDGSDGLYNELLTLKGKGLIRHIGLASENYEIAYEAAASGLYETVQFPFSMISPDSVLDLVKLCEKTDTGCIAMQPLNGGIVNDIALACGFFQQYENVVPVWGVHTDDELQQILYFNDHPPVIDDEFKEEVNKVRLFFN
ncbi:MAG: aldo/keto reductase [Treponema sp.]|nr:aldo/keto reductase [Candidatus Treponema equi]